MEGEEMLGEYISRTSEGIGKEYDKIFENSAAMNLSASECAKRRGGSPICVC
jgi:hypothetical protein